ncbi:MAG: hypothetical protein AAB320_07000 [Elusimicrobiota bacterium]
MNNKTQTPLRFSMLCLFTWGFYQVFWFHRQWRWLKERDSLDIKPWARALLAFFFVDALFKRIFELAKEKGHAAGGAAPWLAAAYILLVLCWYLPSPWRMVILLSFIPMLPVVMALNYYWAQELPDAPAPTGFSTGEKVTLAVGGLFTALMLLLTLAPNAP